MKVLTNHKISNSSPVSKQNKPTLESDCSTSLTASSSLHSSEKFWCWMPASWAHFSSMRRDGTIRATQ